MGRSPSSDHEKGLKKGPWTQEEDEKLTSYIEKHGLGSWTALPKRASLNRCGKSCRLRWTNYLRPDIKRGKFSDEEEQMIIKLHSVLGNKWSRIAAKLPGRTDNEIKNYWNTHLRKKLLQMGIDPVTHRPRTDLNLLSNLSQLLSLPINSTSITTYPNIDINALSLQYSNAAELAKIQVLQNIIQLLGTPSPNPSYNIGHSTAVLGLSSDPNNQLMIESTALPSSMNTTPAPFDMKLPELVSVASAETLSVNGNMASNPDSGHGSFQTLPDYDFFDGCEKLLIDDGSSDFFWKDLLN